MLIINHDILDWIFISLVSETTLNSVNYFRSVNLVKFQLILLGSVTQAIMDCSNHLN